MAVSTPTTFKKTHYSIDTPTPSISTGWMADSSDEVEVISIASSGAETTLTYSTHYTLSGLGTASGFTVTMVGTILAGTDILVQPKTSLTTDQNYSYQGSFSSSKTQSGYDLIVNMLKRLKNIADRSIKIPVGEVDDPLSALPNASSRANKYLGFDDDGDVSMLEPLDGDSISAVETIDASQYITITNTDGSITKITIENFISNQDVVVTDAANHFEKAISQDYITLTAAPTVAIDASTGNRFELTLNQDLTIANPSNITKGQSIIIVIRQDLTGSWTPTLGDYFYYLGDTEPEVNSAASSVSLLVGEAISATEIIYDIRKVEA